MLLLAIPIALLQFVPNGPNGIITEFNLGFADTKIIIKREIRASLGYSKDTFVISEPSNSSESVGERQVQRNHFALGLVRLEIRVISRMEEP